MGNRFSGPQLQRNKSLSTFGRSSQRGLFQKTKTKLKAIEKKIETNTNHDEIRSEMEAIEKELLNVSNTIKEKNKEKYQEIVRYFSEVQSKVSEKREEVKVEEEPEKILVKKEEEEVELRTPIEFYERPSSPSIKFGVQVMPIKPRVSQELLKRNTVPNSDAAKAEFQEIRALSSDAKFFSETTTTTGTINNGTVKEFSSVTTIERPFQFKTDLNQAEKHRATVDELESMITTGRISSGTVKEYSSVTTIERPFQFKTDLNQVEKIRTAVDELESMIKYFHGTKNDEDYKSLREKLIMNMVKLDNLESLDNPVIKQEKKILIQRIQELIKILERLSEPILAVSNISENEDADSENSAETAI